MASSSRSFKYDVFLSFRGEDTRKTFVDHFYSALDRHLISVFKDVESLQRGESIKQSVFEAIEESRIAVVVFSKNYADSSWCLDELVHIMKCKDERGLVVMPIFYDVGPTDVRNQKRKFGEAFAKQEAKNVTKVEMWRKALFDVSNIAGLEPMTIANGHESQFIEKIVYTILDRLAPLNSSIDEDLVGMRARCQDLESLLDIGSNGVRMVGIWGFGGGGKTTLATFVYMKISQHFQSHCIIEDVREESNKYGLKKLQENILSALFKREEKVHSVVEGKHKMKTMLSHRKVLVLLDDVDKLDQLDALAGKHNWFGSGSRIIITTRDEHLLRTHKVDRVYPVKLLSHDEAIQLFKRHAYNEEVPVEEYGTLSLHVVSYASGLPLSLKVLGSFLYDKNKNQWISALKKLKDIPNPVVMNVLKISYDGLEPYEKELFLDIACFWIGTSPNGVVEVFEACDSHHEIGIKVLIQKALITIKSDGCNVVFDMHDLIQEMGHSIVRGEHPKNPEKHSRVWKNEDIKEICNWDASMENDTIEAITHNFLYRHSLLLSKLVSNKKKLRWFIVYSCNQNEEEDPIYLSNELRYIGLYMCSIRKPFVNSFLPMKLVVLRLSGSMQKELWKGYQDLPHLKVLHLHSMTKLLNTPDFNGLPSLEKLTLDCCTELKEIHPSLGNRTSLIYLNISRCKKLRGLPTISHMKNIKTLLITQCSLKDGEIRCGIGELSSLQELNLSGNSFSRLYCSLLQLTRLKSLNLSGCDQLLELPELPSSLTILTAHHCKSLTFVSDFNKNCEQLCQVSLKDGWSNRLLQSMLKGETAENGCMHLYFEGVEIPKGFTPPLLRGSGYRLKLPENWCSDFSGFLMCAVYSGYGHLFLSSVLVTMKHVSGVDPEDDVVWDESVGGKHTYLWYVSFGSLRHTAWWDQTYNAVFFNTETPSSIGDSRRGFGVALVDKKTRSGLIETLTDSSSGYMPKIHIQDDSASALTVNLTPYDSTTTSDRYFSSIC